MRLGQVYFALGDFRRACECCQRNIDGLGDDVIHERFGEPFLPSVLSRTFLVRSLAELGAFADGLMRAEEALRIAERLDQRDSVLATCQALGFLHLRRGALDDAIRWLERGRGLCEAWNIRTYRSAVTARLGYAYALSGRHADGLRLLEEGMAIGVSQGELNGQAAHLADLSHALLLAGRSRDALEAATRGIERARSTRHAAHEAWAAWALGEAESHRDPVNAEDAVAAYRQAMALAEERGMRPLLAHCHLGLGRLQRRLDKRQQAQEHVTAATTMYREMDMRFWLEQAEHEGRAP